MSQISRKYEGETCVVIATGPSLNDSQIECVKESAAAGNCRVMTINNSYQIAPFTDIQIACNDNWWDHYWKEDSLLRELKADKWTRYEHQSKEFGISYIASIEKQGLSLDPSLVHINNGSGPMAINFATLYGFKKLLLLGHDMKFAKDYDGRNKIPGSTPRHYFGEYPKSMQHFPRSAQSVDKNGDIIGLIKNYVAMIPDLDSQGVEVINCTPDTSLKCFKQATIQEALQNES
tara:strand:+ start:1612 stop:2310 length:699 start_codon:yes stop_codon:yes gene_type:complete